MYSDHSDLNEIVSNDGFGLVSRSIFLCLDNRNLLNCYVVNKAWKRNIEEQKFFIVRRIKAKLPHALHLSWNGILNRSDKATVMEIEAALEKFTNIVSNVDFRKSTPLHMAAATNNMSLFEYFYTFDATQIEQGIFCLLHNYYLMKTKQTLLQAFHFLFKSCLSTPN